MKKLSIPIFVFLASGLALASSCPDVRLDNSGTLASYPVFDQATATASTDLNICYAATAAHLIDTYRATQKTEKQMQTEITSPWWVAVNYASAFKKKEEDPDVQFGEPDKALQALKADGICTQQDLFENKPTEEVIQFHQLLRDFYKSYAKREMEDASGSEKLRGILARFDFFKDPKVMADVSVKAIQEKTFVQFLRSLFQAKCQGKVKTNSPYEIERIDADRLNLPSENKADLIGQTLLRSQPIEVSICSQVLRNPQYVPAEDYKKCMRHSVLVVGSREVQGQCQYLVRDSYGEESCQRKRQGQPWYHPSLECQKGQVWVPGQALLLNTWGLTRVMALATPPGPSTPVGISSSAAAATASSTKHLQAQAPPAEEAENLHR